MCVLRLLAAHEPLMKAIQPAIILQEPHNLKTFNTSIYLSRVFSSNTSQSMGHEMQSREELGPPPLTGTWGKEWMWLKWMETDALVYEDGDRWMSSALPACIPPLDMWGSELMGPQLRDCH